MNIDQLRRLAHENRVGREAAVALLLATGILAVFFFIPGREVAPAASQEAAVAAAVPAPDSYKNLPIQGKAAIVLDLSTGETLYTKNANAQLPLASLTKLLTVYAAVHELGLDSVVTIDHQALSVDGPDGVSGFSEGEKFTLKDLASFTLTASVNAGATELAEMIAHHDGATVQASLAAAAADAALSETYAVNGSGLDISPTVSGGYGSAHDVALLAGALLAAAPSVAEATTKSSVSVTSLEGHVHTLPNTNQGVVHTPSLLLSKTGYTDLAGGNLVVVFDAGIGHPVAVAVLGSTQDARFADVDTLIAATLAHFANLASL
jgi:D-alanyl-D-alanine carboxypeptidase (penicillin-binding protein 5/6)